MEPISDRTKMFRAPKEVELSAREILHRVRAALEEKSYRPVDQIVGYLISGDPAYITSHNQARVLIKRIERDELLEEMVRYYFDE